MQEVINLLKEVQYGFLATVDNGTPKVRPFGFMFEEENRLYFCTNSNKEVFRQLNILPLVEYSATTKNMVTVRITGEVTFTEDLDKKQKAINANPLVKKLYQTAENPIFKVFYIEHGSAIISDFSGQPPKNITF